MDIEAELRDLTARRDIYDALCRYIRGIAGRYIDRYEDRGDGWRIAKRRELIDWARTDPASDSFLHGGMRLVMGARGAADFSNIRKWP